MKNLLAILWCSVSGVAGVGLLIAGLACPTTPVVANEGALIFPTRVVFAARTRSAEVNLFNHGSEPVTYRIELIDHRMNLAGGLVVIDEPTAEDRSARGLLRYAPRQVTVPPGSSQKIRLALRKPAGLEPGEYRSHLLCRALPPETEGSDVEVLDQEDVMGIRLTALPAVAIPVIVRHGELQASVGLSELSFEPGIALPGDPTVGSSPPAAAPELWFRLHRQGDISVFGDLTATFVSRRDGSETVIGMVKGVAVYPPLSSITQRLRLYPVDGLRLADGRLRLSFRGDPENDGGAQSQADAEIELR